MNELISFHLSDIIPPYFSHLSPLYFLSNLQTTRNTNIPTTRSSFTRRVTPRDSSSSSTPEIRSLIRRLSVEKGRILGVTVMHEGGRGGEGRRKEGKKREGVRRRSRAARRIVNVGAGDTRISSTRQRKSRRFYLWGGTGDVSHWRDDESVRLCTRLNLHSRGKLSLTSPFCPFEPVSRLDVPRIYSGSARSIALLPRKFRPRRRGKSPPDTILLSRWLSARRVFSVPDPLDSRWSEAPRCFRTAEYI